ncbi:MAG: type II secretion system F family protein [Acidimicrobiales bacterium]
MIRVLAALAGGAFVWMCAEILAGRPVTIRARRPGPRPVGRRANRQVWLSQAGAAVTPRQFWAVCAATAAATFLVLFAIDRTLVVALVPAAGAGALPYLYWSVERRKRADARFEAWPDALRNITGGLLAGIATLHEAMEELAVSGPVALQPPFARYSRLVGRGVGERQALEAIREELADPVSDAVILNLELAALEGTEVALRVLGDLASQITADLELAEKVRTIQTQSRIAGWAVFVLPYALLVFLCASEPLYRQFFGSSVGLLVVLLGAAMSLIGFSAVRKLSKPISPHERIFASSAPAAGRDLLGAES